MTGPEPEPIAAKATARRMPTGTAAHTTAATLCLVLVMLPASAHALDADAPAALLQLINSHRVVAQRCNGVSLAAREPLRAVPVLAAAPARPAGPGRGGLNASLRAAGYAPARSLAIDLSGPRDAGAAMRLLVARHCAALSSALYSDIGLARNTDRWRVVLAEPLLSPTLGTAAEAGPRVLQLVNAARAVPRRCGQQRLPAAPPLAWSAPLAAASLLHSRDMAARDTLSHVGADGSRAGQRARRQGPAWRSVVENVAAGQGSAEQVVADWIASPGHCVNLMRREFTQMGAAYVVEMRSSAVIYWTQVFGSPRSATPVPARG